MLEDCCGATDYGNHLAAIKMVKMQGGVFGAVSNSAGLRRRSCREDRHDGRDECRRETAVGVETIGMTMRFGAFTALDDVSIKVPAGSFHALLGENGAGKSTLVKCMMGFYHPTSGDILVDGREVDDRQPQGRLGARARHGLPAFHAGAVADRRGKPGHLAREGARHHRLAQGARRRSPPSWNACRSSCRSTCRWRELAAGEKQKLEILKQLYLGRSFLVLDEPTSVLTPGEAEEVLGLVRDMTEARRPHRADDHRTNSTR